MFGLPSLPQRWVRRVALLPAVLATLAILSSSAVMHQVHHLLDPHCAEDSGPGNHHCLTCQSLHGGSETGHSVQVVPVAETPRVAPAAPVALAPASHAPESHAARGPPLA